VGFDNIPEGAMRRPSLTTVAIGAREIGEEAARLLLRRIKSPGGSSESVILPPKLVIRESCGLRPPL
jgi:LacI family transcriptional regulator